MKAIEYRVWDGEKIVYQDDLGWFPKCKCPNFDSLQDVQLGMAIRVLTPMQFTGLLRQEWQEDI